ncbi:MAG: zincin-like metallopeptidase domain-containing protein, partial [Phycisphaerae bacterium]
MSDSKQEERASGSLGQGSQSFDLYAEITQQIIAMLDKGVVPWRSPILGQGKAGFPKNLDSGKPYRGVNVFLLAFTAYLKGYGSSYWLTFNQAKASGGSVKKGEKSAMVVFWKQYEVEDRQTGMKKQVPVMRFYRVFNAEQCDGIKPRDAAVYVPTPFEAIAAAEALVKGYANGPAIEHGGQQAYYRPSSDTVKIPEPSRFSSNEEYYSTLLHELSHSTGIKSRLDRGLDTDPKPFGSPDYGKEELIAEMAASFLCGQAGITPAVIENQAAYLSGWLGRLKQDKKLIIQAAAAGQRAADWIRGQRGENGIEGQGTGPGITVPQGVPAETGFTSAAYSLANPSADCQRELEQAARQYIRRGFAPVPVPAGQKGPRLAAWQHLRLREQDVAQAFHGAGNLGLILGEASGNLVDVDLDCPEARELADRLLPPTDGVTGRPSSPRSHRWYICPDLQTVRHRDPVTHGSIVELRGTGSQTLVGPSIHPSGEHYDFLTGDPAQVEATTLREAVAQMAAEVIQIRHGSTPNQP